ncbi:MAG: PLP-dependent aminotransferase family protein [Acidaminococcaceae bacterium]|nr:PLP-dependent aminotransferase family protein [Acidaminococcaceae bacterium]
MLIENFLPDIFSKEPLYLQIGHFIRQEIRSGQLPPGTKLPSIRHLAAMLQISRTTAETCYNQLMAEGFVESLPQKGYYVADLLLAHTRTRKTAAAKTEQAVRYDFANNYIDASTFPAALWRRHFSQALHEKDILSGYGDPQGEPSLRKILAEYSHESRGVQCAAEQIVVGAGVQSLLEIISAVLQDTVFSAEHASAEPVTDIPSIALEEPGFPQAEEIFRRTGWQVGHFTIETMSPELPRLLYVSPSNPYKGRSLTPEQRRSLLRWSSEHQTFILEDDYNGEFRYFSTPVTSLQGMSDGEYIIYLGSFSRLLLPGLRLSYAVLPNALLPAYEKIRPLYNQTASIIEQLALASFMKEGSLRRHVRKLKHLYKEKNTLLRQCLQQYFGSRVQILSYESGLHMRIAVQNACSAEALTEKALAEGVKVIPVKTRTASPEFLLSFAGIRTQDIEPAVRLLSSCWKEETK